MAASIVQRLEALAIVVCMIGIADRANATTIAVDQFISGVPGGYVIGDLTPSQNPTNTTGFSGAWADGTTATGTWVISSTGVGLTSNSTGYEAGNTSAYNGGAPTGVRRVFRNLAAYSAPSVGTPTYWMSGIVHLDSIDDAGLSLGGFGSAGTSGTDTDFFSASSDFQIQGVTWGFEGQGAGTGNDSTCKQG